MFRSTNTIITVSLLFLALHVFSQDDISRIIPATPTTAALGKYGEVPISLHTGIPTIKVPLTQLSGKDLSLSIELSYHAGGVKVEEVSSWVGLGWSLFAGGVITRQIRSLPDEESNGYFYNTTKNSEFINEATGLPNQSYLVQLSLAGLADFEPDIFYFNFGNESGKFIYDDETEKFVTIGGSIKRIDYDFNQAGWVIISEDGTKYYFFDRELNANAAPCQASTSNTTTGWYLTKIVNMNSTDSILFEYQPYTYSFETLSQSERKYITQGSEGCAGMGFGSDFNTCFKQNEFFAQRLKTIRARSGKVEFVTYAEQRWDMANDYALELIKIYNYQDELMMSYKLSHDYFGSQSSGQYSYLYRLKLQSISKITATCEEHYRAFEYTPHMVPSRLSYAQDFWGHYNGKTTNQHLIPSIALAWPDVNQPVMITGADRNPSGINQHAQMGMLKKIEYPTGGYTLFEYENHKVNNNGVFLPVINEKSIQMDILSGTGSVYDTTFVIDYGPNPLNGMHDEGGAFVNFLIDGITCDYGQESGQASTGCAVIALSGPSGFTLTGNLNNRYLPNGTYTFTLNFSTNNDPQSWQDFYARISWSEADTSSTSGSSVVGGLRIKAIKDYDGDSNEPSSQRYYKYYSENDTLISSAEFDAPPSFKRYVWYQKEVACPGGIPCDEIYVCRPLKLSATSNYPVAGFNGSVTYGFVSVFEEANGLKGKTTYKYTNQPDPINLEYPYIPLTGNDWRRGLLLEQKEYRYNAGLFQLLSKTRNSYKELSGISTLGIRISPSRMGDEVVYLDGVSDHFTNGDYSIIPYPIHYSLFAYPDSTIVTTIDPDDPTRLNQSITVSTVSFNHFNVVKQETTESDGSVLLSRMKYVDDYHNSGTDSLSLTITQMKSRNMRNIVIEQNSWKKYTSGDSTLLSSTIVLHKIDQNKILKQEVLDLPVTSTFIESDIYNNQFIYSNDYEGVLHFTKYDQMGNIIEAYGRDSIVQAFLWGNGLNLIAIAKQARSSEIFHTSFEDSSGTIGLSRTGNKYYNNTSFTIPAADRPTGSNLVMTYWYYDGSWKFQDEVGYNPVISKPGASRYDEVRVYPKGAQMTTYTYKPGIGISSVTDHNSITNYYQYDNFGRLYIMKDHTGNVLANYKYNYKHD